VILREIVHGIFIPHGQKHMKTPWTLHGIPHRDSPWDSVQSPHGNSMEYLGVEGAGLVPWVVGPPDASL